jgi:Flp pilus assembly protein TadD
MKSAIRLLALAFAYPCVGSHAQIYPLSENTWSNPQFVQRFLGTYGFDTSLTPTITSEEKALFEKIVPLLTDNPQAAIAQLSAAATAKPSAAISFTLGNLALQTGDTKAARTHYEAAIQGFPNFLRAYKNLGIVHVQDGRYDEAVTMLVKTLQLGGQSEDVYGLLGYSYLNLGDSVSALRAYEFALFLAPTSRDWRMGKIQCLSNLRRWDDAIAMIDGMLATNPQQTELLMLQANAFVAKNEPENAAATLEILLASGRDNVNARLLLGDIYLNFQQPDLALQHYRAAGADATLGADRALRIARRLVTAGSWPQVDVFVTVIRANPQVSLTPAQSVDLLNIEAQADLAQNRNESAADKLAQVVALDPLNGRALLLLANYHWQRGEVERAEIHFERAVKVEAVAQDALVQHARMLVANRNYRQAVDLLERSQTIRHQAHIAQFIDKVAAASRATGR